ncbi:MAG: hypothetical protein A2W93_02205 [Bacteroidetes bacterium GWF2_43_63]|nr:MAG: hypothetical protein A2W93_02205 [Bacteroidetes bacterium GWF2_43_63]HBG69277.1 hypothetical protein [Bacteroidales bacterium]HCB60331.1 hypothetical protein [Bacteroidales bacterium]HCY23682.1 hypothetical protein [Bacteroidales bacterium]
MRLLRWIMVFVLLLAGAGRAKAAGGGAAVADIFIQSEKQRLIEHSEFQQYESTFATWDKIYNTAMILDAGANLVALGQKIYIARQFKKFIENTDNLVGCSTKTLLKEQIVAIESGVKLEGTVPYFVAKWNNLSVLEAKSLYTQLAKTEIQGSKVFRTQAEILTEIQQRGITNPYNFAYAIEDYTLTKETFFVRGYNQYKEGRWLISIDDVGGFSSVDDFINQTALPIVDEYGGLVKPDKLLLVKVPPGTIIRKSVARPQDWGGQGHLSGGATQYEIINFSKEEMENFFEDIGDINEFIN